MHSSTSNFDFERVVPDVPWRGVLLVVVLFSAAAVAGWEGYVRHLGYEPTLNDSTDLWAEARRAVRPDSIVLAGTSRVLFDLDLDALEQGLGRRPIQLGIVGSTPFPVLADLAADETFRGTLLLDILPALYLAPAGPPMEASRKALQRYHTWNHAQQWSHELAIPLERRLAFLKQEELSLGKLLEKLPIPDRADARVGPRLPPYFASVDRDRRTRMVPEAATVGSPLQHRVSTGWSPLFTRPAPPSFIPPEQFGHMMQQAIGARFRETAAHVDRIRARRGKVVFLRLPVSGPLVAREEELAPRARTWDALVKLCNVPAIHFADHADLSGFECPEWSHLSAADSVEFTRRLVPHLQTAFKSSLNLPVVAAAGATGKP